MKLTKIIAILVLVAMFFPFVAVSCEDTEVASASNVTLALGIDKNIDIMGEKEKAEVTIVFTALVSLVLAIVGLVYFFKNPDENILDNVVGMGIYALLIFFLLFIPKGVENMIGNTSDTGAFNFEVHLRIGYFIALIASVGMVVYSFLGFKKKK